MFSFILPILLLACFSPSYADVLSGQGTCSCGFYDTTTEEMFTDSIVVYFNETISLPEDFIVEDYENKYEKDWNAVYRQGADPANVQPGKNGSLELYVSPPSDHHLVNGGGIRTTRRDIHYGSFRTLMRSPKRTSGGSAMSMMWKYNETEVAELSLMNSDFGSEPWVGTFVNAEFTTQALGVNYSTALNGSAANRNYTTLGPVLKNGSLDLWDFTEYRIDWTKDNITFYIGGNLTRSISHKKNKGMPSVPSPLFFKHWSTGNRFSMQGPPQKRSVAELGWIRMFFNSSSMTEDSRKDFDTQCSGPRACSMDDITLRGSTSYSEHATKKWKQRDPRDIKRMPALWLSVVCLTLSTFLLVHAVVRRAPWRKRSPPKAKNDPCNGPSTTPFEKPRISYPPSARDEDPSSWPLQTAGPGPSSDSTDDLAIEATSDWGGSTPFGPSRTGSIRFDSQAPTPRIYSPSSSDANFNRTVEELYFPRELQQSAKKQATQSMHPSEHTLVAAPSLAPTPDPKVHMETVTESALPAPRMAAHPPAARDRVDYLAGLVAMCAVLVTVMHFGLTFVPALVIPDAPAHHRSEKWANEFIAPFILNQMWLGVFFTTSARFLVMGYLRRGDMQGIAKAAVRRTPRLMIPVASIAMLEYFIVDCGGTKYLRYIPSLTWSTWPYVTRFPTFGHFISEILELIYLVPNAVPQITFNYCTGVLWTIAVQLQGTWLVLCGVIVVYEVKTPWKRMAYYAFCVLNHWYAQSWGSYLWLGLLLTDLDITYKYRPYLHARPLIYYPLMCVFWLCVAAGFSFNMIPHWVDFNFATYEHNIHPDIPTGEPLWNTSNAGYPAYFVPRLNGLLFATGMQAIVELSPLVQKILSMPPLLILFPHIFTIYLLHGLVFWTWGSWLMIFLADRNFTYGVNVAIVGVTSYVLLGCTLPIVTPIIEALGKDITSLVWMSATEKSPPRRRTLFPFPEDLLKGRGEEGKVDPETGGSRWSGSVVEGKGGKYVVMGG